MNITFSLKIYLKWISLLKLCKVDLRWTLKSCANILKFIQTFNHPSPFFILSKRVRNKNSIDFRFFFYPSLNEKKNLQQHAAVEFLYQWWMNHDDTYQIVFRRSSWVWQTVLDESIEQVPPGNAFLPPGTVNGLSSKLDMQLCHS